jgi:hypothetical protein
LEVDAIGVTGTSWREWYYIDEKLITLVAQGRVEESDTI